MYYCTNKVYSVLTHCFDDKALISLVIRPYTGQDPDILRPLSQYNVHHALQKSNLNTRTYKYIHI
jgi:hypothetical protein